MTHPRSLAQAPFGYAQGRRDRCARMGHAGGPFTARLKSCPDKSCPNEAVPERSRIPDETQKIYEMRIALFLSELKLRPPKQAPMLFW